MSDKCELPKERKNYSWSIRLWVQNPMPPKKEGRMEGRKFKHEIVKVTVQLKFQLWYTVTTFANFTIDPQYNNMIIKRR
jgi:hypothetical protein